MRTPRLATERLTEPTWRGDARCRSKTAVHFFAPPHLERAQDKRAREAAARELCGGCTVRDLCLEYAVTVREPHGIWGGLTELERRRLVRRRADEADRATG